jgi:hypothetical protein
MVTVWVLASWQGRNASFFINSSSSSIPWPSYAVRLIRAQIWHGWKTTHVFVIFHTKSWKRLSTFKISICLRLAWSDCSQPVTPVLSSCSKGKLNFSILSHNYISLRRSKCMCGMFNLNFGWGRCIFEKICNLGRLVWPVLVCRIHVKVLFWY